MNSFWASTDAIHYSHFNCIEKANWSWCVNNLGSGCSEHINNLSTTWGQVALEMSMTWVQVALKCQQLGVRLLWIHQWFDIRHDPNSDQSGLGAPANSGLSDLQHIHITLGCNRSESQSDSDWLRPCLPNANSSDWLDKTRHSMYLQSTHWSPIKTLGRLYLVIVCFMPVLFQANKEGTCKLELIANLPENSVSQVKWIKNLEHRSNLCGKLYLNTWGYTWLNSYHQHYLM